jgi:hypothetical protein
MEFHGLILVRGKISISGTGFKVFGGMMAANMNGGGRTCSRRDAVLMAPRT